MPFDPTTLAGCVLWLSADRLALADNTAVSAWGDGSTAGNNASQATGAAQPTYRAATGPNGKPVVVFDGADDYLSLLAPIAVGIGGNSMTVFAVAQALADGCVLGRSGFNVQVRATPASGTLQLFESSGGQQTSAVVPSSLSAGYNILTWQAPPVAYYQNGHAVANASGTGTTSGFSLDIVGADQGVSALWWNGGIAQLIVYNRVLGVSEIATVTGGLAAEYLIGYTQITVAPFAASLVWGGFPSQGGIGGGFNAIRFYGANTEVRFGFTGAQIEAQMLAQGGVGGYTVSIDGGAAAPVSVPVGGSAWLTLASGLTDAAHTCVLANTSSGVFSGLDLTAAFRATGGSPAFSVYPGFAGTVYLLDGSQTAGIVPDTGATPGGASQGYPGTTYLKWDLGSLRFRARCTDLWLWAWRDPVNFGLTVDGVDQAPVNASVSTTFGWVHVGSGLDDTAYHNYILRRVWMADSIVGGNPWVYQLLASSTTGGGIDLAHPPTTPAPLVLAFGDSITEAVQVAPADSRDGYAYLLAKALGWDVANRGINGTPIHDFGAGSGTSNHEGSGQFRVGTDVAAVSPVPFAVVEIYGVNDLKNNIVPGSVTPETTAQFQASCLAVYTSILTAHPGVRLLAVGILPTCDPTWQTSQVAANAAKAAAVAQAKAAFPSSGVYYLDPTGWIDPGVGTWPTAGSVDTVDGLHPNVSGHTKIAAQLLLYLEQPPGDVFTSPARPTVFTSPPR